MDTRPNVSRPCNFANADALKYGLKKGRGQLLFSQFFALSLPALGACHGRHFAEVSVVDHLLVAVQWRRVVLVQ